MSLEASDKEAAAVAVAPRVSLADIEAQIAAKFETTAFDATVFGCGANVAEGEDIEKISDSLKVMSVCILVMKNGFTVIGHSAPASRENFSPTLGKKYAYDDCIRKVWPLMGYCLRQKLHEAESV